MRARSWMRWSGTALVSITIPRCLRSRFFVASTCDALGRSRLRQRHDHRECSRREFARRHRESDSAADAGCGCCYVFRRELSLRRLFSRVHYSQYRICSLTSPSFNSSVLLLSLPVDKEIRGGNPRHKYPGRKCTYRKKHKRKRRKRCFASGFRKQRHQQP